MGSRLIGDWDKLENALRNAGNKIDEAATKAAGQAGFLLVKRIKEGIKSQAPAGQVLLGNVFVVEYGLAQTIAVKRALILPEYMKRAQLLKLQTPCVKGLLQ